MDLIDRERLDCFAVYLSLSALHRVSFEDAMADPALSICLRNTAHARREALRKLAKPANDAPFELTP